MQALTMRLTGFLAIIVAFLTFSSFGSVPTPSAGEGRVPEHRIEAKKANRKAARLEAKQEQLRTRIEKASTEAQKERLQRQLDRTERPNKAEILGKLAFIFGIIGMALAGLALLGIILWFVGVPILWFFWFGWSTGLLLSVAALVLGIIGKKLNDDPSKAKKGMLFGIIGLAIWAVAMILYFIFWGIWIAGI